MAANTYQCYANNCHEDVTDQVLANVAEACAHDKEEVVVVATCSRGHTNVFELSGNATRPRANYPGRAPTSVESFWLNAIPDIEPGQSMSRMQDHAKSIITVAAIVGTVAGGFGLLGADRLRLTPAPLGLPVNTGKFLIVALGLGLVSVVAAALVLTTSVKDVCVSNINSIERVLITYQTKWRLHVVRFASVVAIAALIMAFLAVLAPQFITSPPPTVSTVISAPRQTGKITIRVQAHDLAADRRLETNVFGVGKTSEELLLQGSAAPDSTGRVDVSSDLTGIAAYDRVRVTVKVTPDGSSVEKIVPIPG